jgi:hypothetical protein
MSNSAILEEAFGIRLVTYRSTVVMNNHVDGEAAGTKQNGFALADSGLR